MPIRTEATNTRPSVMVRDYRTSQGGDSVPEETLGGRRELAATRGARPPHVASATARNAESGVGLV
jgi:hypothetical protein